MNTFIIDDLLEIMAIEGRRRFSPNYVCERLNIDDIMAVADYLISLTGQKLVPQFEVECPNGDSDFSVSDPRLITSDNRCCSICGEEYMPDPDRVWLVFDFTDKFVDHIKKKKTTAIAATPSRKFKIQTAV